MLKRTAFELLGGSASEVARHVGVSVSAVGQWPEELPPRIADRVLAALYRLEHPEVAQPNAAPLSDQAAA